MPTMLTVYIEMCTVTKKWESNSKQDFHTQNVIEDNPHKSLLIVGL